MDARNSHSARSTITVDDFDVWQDGVSSTFVPLRSDPIGPGSRFHGSLSTGEFGKVRISRVRATPHAVWRSGRDLADGLTNEVKISFVMAGEAAIEQHDEQAVVHTGGAALYDCDHRYRLSMDRPFEQVVMQLDRHELEQLVALPSGRLLAFAPQNLFMRCLRSLADELTAGERPAAPPLDDGPTNGEALLLGEKMLEFLALAISDATTAPVSGGPTRRQMYMRAVRYVHQHIGDSSLAPAGVANAVGLSRASLYQIFAGEGQTVAAFIIAERLDQARRELYDPHCADRSITEIAMRCGFKSAAHFSRRFVERFETTPSDFRRRQSACTNGQLTRRRGALEDVGEESTQPPR